MLIFIALAAAVAALAPVCSSQPSEKLRITLRQCRWSPHTARGENGNPRLVHELKSPELSALFAYDEEDDWQGYTDTPTLLRADSLLPKWIFRNSGVQALLAAVLLVNRVSLESEKSASVFYITPWSMLICGVFKFHSERNLYDLILTQVLVDENKLADLIDLVYRLGLCVSNEMADSCPSECNADEAFVPSCSGNMANVQRIKSNCHTELPAEMKYEPFRSERLDNIDVKQSGQEIIDFREWHSTLPPSKRIPLDIFEENLQSHKLLHFVMTELLAHDPDEKPVTLDDHYVALHQRYVDSGCDKDDSAVHSRKECLHFRIVLHTRLVTLQKHLVSRRICLCSLGYRWDPEKETCAKRLLGYCHEQDLCKNGGKCEAIIDQDNQNSLLGSQESARNSSSIRINCTCPAAWKGNWCEVENDVCQTLPSASTCGDHVCQRDPNVEQGFYCLCPPGTHVRASNENPRCRDVNECEDSSAEMKSVCKNDGECVNHDPGFTCNCKHGYSGVKCEFPPDPPTWAEWEHWSKCILPDKAMACQESPMQVRIRRCQASGIAQHCEGPRREIRFICPGEMNNWDTIACSKFRGNLSKLKFVSYLSLDYVEAEEFGKFSAHEVELVLEDRLQVYLQHYWLLVLAFVYCLLTPVVAGWCLWRLMRGAVSSGRLARSQVAMTLAKQRAEARAEAESQAAAHWAREEAQRAQAREMRAAAKAAEEKERLEKGQGATEGAESDQKVDRGTAATGEAAAVKAANPTEPETAETVATTEDRQKLG